jgi:hypothetical protein
VESFAYGICFLIGFQLMLSFIFGIYMAPMIVAVFRNHHRWPWIGFLNFATGWTVVGWIAALVWSVTAIRQPPAITSIGRTA